jgi:1-acyl-sn-glycerol-3-phosphate acyltransferase
VIKKIFAYFFKRKGWTATGTIPKNIKKCIIIGAPHTSNWDFVYGVGSLNYYNIDIKYLAKKELFVFPFKKMFYALGGIPVDRSKSGSLVDQIIEMFNKSEELIVLIPPEGTRKKVRKWKTGFYRIALGAKVPIILGALDYKAKTTNLGPVFYPTGNMEEDFAYIRNYYEGVNAKIPENFSPPYLD